jgi:hypothetical protein
LFQDPTNLRARKHNRQPPGNSRPHDRAHVIEWRPQDFGVKKEEGTHRLSLCGARYMTLVRQEAEERDDFFFAQRGGMSKSVISDVATDPG